VAKKQASWKNFVEVTGKKVVVIEGNKSAYDLTEAFVRAGGWETASSGNSGGI